MDKKLQGANAYKAGLVAEFFCKLYLQLKFYIIIARRYRNDFGEIDIIARKGKNLIFIEVKAREKEYFELVTSKQKHRIINTAKVFLAKNSCYVNFNIRFDVLIYKNPFQITPIKQAWIDQI